MKHPSSYLKMRILAAVDYAPGKTIRERIQSVAKQQFMDEEGSLRQFTWRTISTWLYRYKKRGVTGLDVKTRSDKGKVRKMTPEELLEVINSLKQRFHSRSHTKLDLYRTAIAEGLICQKQLSQTNYYRFLREYELLEPDPEKLSKRRQAFSMEYANDLWQADTMFGPFVSVDGKKVQSKLIAFIDDASRVICHAQFYSTDTAHDLINTFRAAIYKRGIPKQLYVDNGSSYSSLELKLVCKRIGCVLRFTPVRDAAAKGKIERFFRTLRTQFLTRKLDLSSLKSLNKQLSLYIEEEYNSRTHSGIGMKPIDRFSMDNKQIQFLSPSNENNELFYAETERSVKNDNTFSFQSRRYETPVHLAGKKIQIRFDRRTQETLIIYYNDQRMGHALPVNLIQNGQRRSQIHD